MCDKSRKKCKVKSLSRVRFFSTPMDSSLPGSFVHGIFQARILEWVAISFSILIALKVSPLLRPLPNLSRSMQAGAFLSFQVHFLCLFLLLSSLLVYCTSFSSLNTYHTLFLILAFPQAVLYAGLLFLPLFSKNVE